MTATPGAADTEPARHVLFDLGWEVRRVDGELRGVAPVVPEMHVPGTDRLRTSILAAWADALAGMLTVEAIDRRVPVTLDLDVHLSRPAPDSGTVTGTGSVVRAGRSFVVAGVEFGDGTGEPFGFGTATFVPAGDRTKRMPPRPVGDWILPGGGRLLLPFAERAGCERREPGVAVLQASDEVLNAAGTVNGGLIALAAEEAALSLTPGRTLSTLVLRYLQPASVGPVVAEARVRDGLGRVTVRDAGNDDRLCVTCTSRVFG